MRSIFKKVFWILSILGFMLSTFVTAAPTAVPAAPSAAPAPPVVNRTASNAKELSEALNITGQSRNLSIGLLLGNKSSLSFGNVRTNYKDKIIIKQMNF